MADIDLPVFSFRLNWREPLTERLAFKTDVLTASEGAEQRRSLRQTARRTFEADFLLSGPERTFWDLFINRLGGGEFMAPLYWEVTVLTAALPATTGDRIDFDTSYREWSYYEGGLALLIGESALDFEVVEIAAVDAGGVDLAAPATRQWPRGTKFLPLRRAVLEQAGNLAHKSAGTATVAAEIRIAGATLWTPAADASPVYEGLPVFLDEPNWVEDLVADYDRQTDLLDTGIGLTYQVDVLGRALIGQSHRWFLPGREKLAGFRDLIYRHLGRAGAFWLPTFKADLRLVAAASSGATQITVVNAGYGYTGGPTSGREYIAIKHSGGTILRKVLAVIPGLTSDTERLGLDAPVGLALSPGRDLRISFVDTARFDNDVFEIVHFGGVDAHHEAGAIFRTFKNTRTAPEPINYPIPTAFMSDTPCGTAATYSCLRILITEAEGGTATSAGFSRVQFLANTENGIKAIPFDGATATASSIQGGGYSTSYPMEESRSVNENWETWESNAALSVEPAWYQVCFPTFYEVVGVTIMGPRIANSATAPKAFKLQGNDGVGWVDILEVTAEPDWSGGELRPFVATDYDYTGSPWGARSHWRYLTYLNNGNNAMAEIEHRIVPSGSDQSGGATFSARSTQAPYSPGLAFDNLVETFWSAPNDGSPPGKYNWVMLDFGDEPITFAELKLRARQDGFPHVTSDGVGYQFADSADGPWTTVLHEQGLTWTAGQERTYTDPLYLP